MQHTPIQSAALLDPRPETEKQKDWKQEEVVATSGVVQWKEKPRDQWRRFPVFDQDGSGSCVMQTQCKEMGIMRQQRDGNYVHFSVADGYQRRANKPDSGMYAYDARKIAQEGVTLEVLSPSQGMSDSQLDETQVEPYKREVGSVFAVPNYLQIGNGDFERVASTIQATGKGVMVWFYFKYDEWTERPVVLHQEIGLNDPGVVRHSVTAVDFTLQGNEKCLVIEDSWGPNVGDHGQRIVTESFFKKRNFYAGYLVNFAFGDDKPEKPSHRFDEDLELGDHNGEVVALQNCLKSIGHFPANTESTGYYGQITQRAVGKFQEAKGVALPGHAGYGRCGPMTRSALNAIFSN